MAEQRAIKLVPYSKEKFPQAKTINGVPVEEVTKKYQTVRVITDEQGKPVRTGEDYFIDEQGNPLKPKELQEVVVSAPAHLSDEEYRQYLLNSQNFNRRQGLPINYDNIPLFTYDNGITGKRNVNRNTYERYIEADNKSRAFNKQMDAIVAGATGIMASPYLLGAAALAYPYIAPGTVGGNILGDTAGIIALDETSKALTGRTTGQHIGDALGLAEDSNWRYATDFANPINIAGPALLRKGVSAGINYAEKFANPYKVFNTLKSPVKISGFQERLVLSPKSQYKISDDTDFIIDENKYDKDLFDIYVSPEILAKRSNNAEHAIDIYRKRLNNGGIKLVYDRGTANYKVSDIKVAQSDKDILASIKALEADNPIPPAADYYNLKKDLLDLREGYVVQDSPRSLNEIKKELYNREGWEDLTSADFDDFAQYIVAKPSPKLKNWILAKDKASQSRGYSRDNFAWAPNKETLEQILNNYFSNLDKEEVANNLKYWQNALPHEFEHTFQNAFKLYKKYYSPKHLIPKMDESTKLSPEQFNLIADEMSQLIGFRPKSRYFLNLTELLGRGTQIKNWLGITDPQYQLTVRDIKEAAKYYPKTGLNNNMEEFFNSITDWDKAAKFLSYATAVAGVGSTVGLNNTKLVKKPNK